jgi:hypothetical protein
MPLEVSSLGVRRRLVQPAWIGLLLVAIGFLLFLVSYFRLPLYDCSYVCAPHYYFTAWELSLNVLSHFQGAPVPDTFLLLLCYLPLLAAVMVVGCGVVFFVHPQRTFAIRSYRGWLLGSIPLVLLLPVFLFFIIRPDIGYLCMLFSYGLFWGGNRAFLMAHP